MKSGFFLLLFLFINIPMGYAQNIVWNSVLNDIRSRYADVPQVSVDSLSKWMDDRETPVLIDVREQEEYAVSHLKGAINLVPDTEDFSVLDDLPRDTPIVAYCSVGYRSSEMARRLKEAGFTNVSNLEGSIFTWANEDHPVFRGDSVVQAVHPYNVIWGKLLDADLHQYE